MSGFPGNETGSSLSRRGRIVNLGKRDPVGGEAHNNRVTNDMLQALHDLCVEAYGTGWRAAVNYRSVRNIFPVCGPRIEVTERHDIGIHTEWDGIWYPESPKSPGTYDSFAQMAGSLNGYFNFDGAYSNGEGMSSRGSGHSWSCIACPGGKLTITSTDRATWAIGYTSPH
ncbi:hypothetical protein FocTR4_00012040 [Fusarium oxysporum f. sp. cubense]|uniref:Uncharacterized protein n=1 Tax=Fusarium oxysporum f. sp. cubense TaxID=61366 RepID=A0A5C6SJF0_FUSOC|nr:hypothetical protein FocTR4_00012040 [Fusarium oxysporum f. sp. cubense]